MPVFSNYSAASSKGFGELRTINRVWADTFQRTATTSGLGPNTLDQQYWQPIRGNWFVNTNGQAESDDSPATYPISAAYMATPFITTLIASGVSIGTGVTFWQTDANNWYAATLTSTNGNYSYPCITPVYNTCATCTGGGSCATNPSCHTGVSGDCGTYVTTCSSPPVYGCCNPNCGPTTQQVLNGNCGAASCPGNNRTSAGCPTVATSNACATCTTGACATCNSISCGTCQTCTTVCNTCRHNAGASSGQGNIYVTSADCAACGSTQNCTYVTDCVKCGSTSTPVTDCRLCGTTTVTVTDCSICGTIPGASTQTYQCYDIIDTPDPQNCLISSGGTYSCTKSYGTDCGCVCQPGYIQTTSTCTATADFYFLNIIASVNGTVSTLQSTNLGYGKVPDSLTITTSGNVVTVKTLNPNGTVSTTGGGILGQFVGIIKVPSSQEQGSTVNSFYASI